MIFYAIMFIHCLSHDNWWVIFNNGKSSSDNLKMDDNFGSCFLPYLFSSNSLMPLDNDRCQNNSICKTDVYAVKMI